jgi:hypothetical protein
MRDKDLRQNYISHIKHDEIIVILVARERFELSSRAPEAPMLGRYTTGLLVYHQNYGFFVITLTLRHVAFFFFRASLTQ